MEKSVKGIDRNHRNVLLEQEKWKNREITISLRGYEKPLKLQEEFRSYVRVLEKRVEQYYYDIYVPFEVMCLLEKEDTTYTILLECLQESVKRLDLRKPYSNAFYESIRKAGIYIFRRNCTRNTAVITRKRCSVWDTRTLMWPGSGRWGYP